MRSYLRGGVVRDDVKVEGFPYLSSISSGKSRIRGRAQWNSFDRHFLGKELADVERRAIPHSPLLSKVGKEPDRAGTDLTDTVRSRPKNCYRRSLQIGPGEAAREHP